MRNRYGVNHPRDGHRARDRAAVLAITALLTISTTGCAQLAGAMSTQAPGSAPTPASRRTPPGPPHPRRTTAPPPTTPAPPLSTGSNWSVVIPHLLAYGQWVLANANAPGVPSVAAPGCPFGSALSLLVGELISDGDHIQTVPLSVLFSQGPSPRNTAEVVVTVEVARAAEPRVSSKGVVRSGYSHPALAPTSFDITLDLGADRRWRICGVEDGSPSDSLHSSGADVESLANGEQGLALL